MHIAITAVLNCHREGELLKKSFRSVFESLQSFDASGVAWELLCIADNCDEQTLAILNECVAGTRGREVRVIPSDAGDLGLSRNLAVKHARGEYIGFADGDDLVSRNWFGAAYESSRRARNSIFHPECNFYFGCLKAFFVHRDQGLYDLRALFFHNLWSALSFAHSEIYRKNEYCRNLINQGFGYEDWNWNCETIRRGHEHRMTPGTCHFVRMKQGSLSDNSAKNECLIRPTDLWKYLSAERNARGGSAKWRAALDWMSFRIDRTQRQTTRNKGLLSERMFREPVDLTFEEAPAWVRNQFEVAKTDDPSIDLAGRVINFSPLVDNPFVRYFSDSALDAVSNGLDAIHFFDSAEALEGALPHIPERVFAIVETRAAVTSQNVLSIENLEAQLGSKFEMYLATLAVQSRCREFHIWNSSIGLRVLAKYKLPLRSAISRIYNHAGTLACPEELRSIFDASPPG